MNNKNSKLIITGTVTPTSTNIALVIGTLPYGFRPDFNRFLRATKNASGNSTTIVSCWVEDTGRIRLNSEINVNKKVLTTVRTFLLF